MSNISNIGREVKVVYVDGNLNTGVVRCIRGKLVDDKINTITISRFDGNITIGKHFLVKIEDWK